MKGSKMKIYKLTPKTDSYFDMGIDGKHSVVYVRALDEDMVREFLGNMQLATTISNAKIVSYEHSFARDKANCEELSDKEISNLGLSKDADTEIVLTVKFEE